MSKPIAALTSFGPSTFMLITPVNIKAQIDFFSGENLKLHRAFRTHRQGSARMAIRPRPRFSSSVRNVGGSGTTKRGDGAKSLLTQKQQRYLGRPPPPFAAALEDTVAIAM